MIVILSAIKIIFLDVMVFGVLLLCQFLGFINWPQANTIIIVILITSFLLFVRHVFQPNRIFWTGYTRFGTIATIIMVISAIAIIIVTLTPNIPGTTVMWIQILFYAGCIASGFTTFFFE